MKKRLKGLLVLWLAFLMVVSTPMTANAKVNGVYLYKGTKALNNGGNYGNSITENDYNDLDPEKFELKTDLTQFKSGTIMDTIFKDIVCPLEGYGISGWRFWNSESGFMYDPATKDGKSYVINDSDYNTYIEFSSYFYTVVEPIWEQPLEYTITHQPDNENPYVKIGKDGVTQEELDGIVRKYEWYSVKQSFAKATVVNNAGSDSPSGTYAPQTGIASVPLDSPLELTLSEVTVGDILRLTSENPFECSLSCVIGEVTDGSIIDWSSIENGVHMGKITSVGDDGRINLTISGPADVKIEIIHEDVTSVTGSVFSGENGDYYCKVIFENGGWLKSNTFTYTRQKITPNASLNGSYRLQVDGKDITEKVPGSETDLLAIPGKTVTVVATADEGYELESISVTPDGGDANSIEFKNPTTFIMPNGPISVDVAFKKKTYGITLPTSPVGYSVNPVLVEGGQKTSVEHGNSFTFDVSIAEGYAATNNYAVKANGTTLTATSSKDNVYIYTIENITAEQEITVTGVEKTYPVAMSEAVNGSFSVAAEDGSSTSGAVKGTIFTITPTPAEGYELDTITVTQKDGSDTAVTVNDKNQFTMPKYPVEVSVTFKKKTYGITLPQGQTGYTVTSSQTSPVEHGSDYTFKVTISDGYDVPTALSVKANGNALVATTVSGKEYTYTLEKVASAQEITVDGVSDIAGPEVTITLDAENTWKHFLFKIGFGLFFQEEKKLTIDAVDTGSGRGSVAYYVSETDLFPAEETYSAEEIEKRIPQWTEYSGAVFITVDRSYVVYAKATDIAGNVTYVSTSGMVIDTTKPVISGLEDGGQYYGDTATTISDANLSAVKLDGKAVEFTGTSASVTITADGAEHTIEATDKAGNQTAYKVAVSETWVRDGISSAGSRILKLGVPYKFGSGKWKVAGDTTVYEGGNTFYASEGGTFEFQTQ